MPGKRVSLVGHWSKDYGSISGVGSEAVAGDAAAGDLVGGEGAVVKEAVDFGGLLEPVDEGCHFGVDGVGCASETDVDDDEGHVGDAEVAFRSFPQMELDVAAIVEVVNTGSDGIPVESCIVRIATGNIGDICTHIKKNIQDGVAG